MLRLALLSARGRLGTFTGALVALIASSALVMAGAMPFESALRTHPPVERYAATAAVVTGQQIVGADHDVPLGERARVSSALTARLAAVPGVRAAIADVSAPARLGGRATVAHGWGSAALTPYALTAGRAPAGPDEVVTGYRAKLGATPAPRVHRGRPHRHGGRRRPAARTPSEQRAAIFLTDAEADAAGRPPGPRRRDRRARRPRLRRRAAARRRRRRRRPDRRRAAARPSTPTSRRGATTLIAVTASFGGLALFIAIFVVASTMGLSIQQREREIALLRAVAGTPGQIRRMISWEAVIVGLVGVRGGDLARADPRPRAGRGARASTASPRRTSTVSAGWLPIAAAVAGGVTGRAARRPRRRPARREGAADARAGRRRGRAAAAGSGPRDRRADRARRRGAAVRRLDHHDGSPDTAAATSEMTALFLVAAVGFLGPIVARFAAVDPGAAARRAVAGRRLPGLREPAHRHAALLVGQHAAGADGRPELHAAVQLDHDRPRRHPGAPRRPGRRARRHGRGCRRRRWTTCAPRPECARRSRSRRRRSARAWASPMTSSPPPSSAAARAAGFDAGVTAGSLADLHGDTIALGRRRAEAAARRDRRPRGDHARRRRPHARHRRGDLHPRAGVRRRAARTRARGRPPDRPAARDDPRQDRRPRRRRAAPAGSGRPLSRAAGERPRVAGHRRPTPTARPTAGSARCSWRSSSPSRRSPWSTRSR